MAEKTTKQSIPVENVPSSERLEISLRRLGSSLLKTGVDVALLPVNLLPDESRDHFLAAGREAALGGAALLKAVSQALEKGSEQISSRTG